MMSTVYVQLGTAAIIVAVLGLRAVFKNRFPAKVFVLLWAAVMVWSLLPFGISTDLSIYKFAPKSLSTENEILSTEHTETISRPQNGGAQISAPEENNTPEIIIMPENNNNFVPEISHDNAENSVSNTPPQTVSTAGAQPKATLSTEKIFSTVRICGAAVVATYIIVKYIFDVNKYRRFASPCVGAAAEWLARQPKSGKMSIWESAEVESPLTFGLTRPVILLPLGVTPAQLPNLLAHEYVHARDRDFLLRALCSLALAWCWFNPFIWVAAIYMNRDIERYCDERSIKLLGGSGADYMHTLLDYAERQSGISALSYFSAGSFEERIMSIIKGKNKRIGIISAVVIALIIVAVAIIFGTAPKKAQQPKNEFTKGIYASETKLWEFDRVFGEAYTAPLHTNSTVKWLPDSAIVMEAESGTPVYAMQGGKISGMVRTARMRWAIAIEQADGDTAVYANLATPDGKKAIGDYVKQGDFIANTDYEHHALLVDILRVGESVFCPERGFDWYFDYSAALRADDQMLCDDSAAPELAELLEVLTSSNAFFDFVDFDFAAGINEEQSEYLNYSAIVQAYQLEWCEVSNRLPEEKRSVIAEKWGDRYDNTIAFSMKAISIMYDELFAHEMSGTTVPQNERYDSDGGRVLYIPEIGTYTMVIPQGLFGSMEYPQIFSVEKSVGNYTTYTVKFILTGIYSEKMNDKWQQFVSFSYDDNGKELYTKADRDALISENEVYGARIVKLRDGSTYIDAMWKGDENPFGTKPVEVDPGSLSNDELRAIAEDAVMNFGAEQQEDGTLRVSDWSLFWSSGFNSADDISGYRFWAWRVDKAWRNSEEIPEKSDGGWYFPSADYEQTIQKYFDVSTETLRSDEDGVYHPGEDAYYPTDGDGGRGAPEEVHILSLERSGDLLLIKLELVFSDTGLIDEHRTLTIRVDDDGSYKFASYSRRREIYQTTLSANGSEVEAAIAAVRAYVHHDLPQSVITDISADINQTNFFINRAFAEEYGTVSDRFTTPEYCMENFIIIRTVRKFYFANQEERAKIYSRVNIAALTSMNESPFAYLVFRDEQTGEWSVDWYVQNDYHAFDEVEYNQLRKMFLEDYDVLNYAEAKVQKSEIDPEGSFAKSCTDAVQKEIFHYFDSFDGVKSCRVISCEVDMYWTNQNIKAYWKWGGIYPNYTLAKRFLNVNTVVELELAEGYEDSDFSRFAELIDFSMGQRMRLKKSDIVIYDPENLVKWSRTSESGWKRVDGYPFYNA